MKKIIIGMVLLSAVNIRALQTISDADFFKLFSDGGAKQVIQLLKANPQLANRKNPLNQESTLFAVLRNYSAVPDELNLIELLISLQPSLVTDKNPKGSSIFDIIFTFDDQDRLRQLVQQSLAKVFIHPAIKNEFIQAITDKNYEKAEHFFVAHPELINVKGPKGQNILYYLNHIPHGALDRIRIWATLIDPHMKEHGASLLPFAR